MTEPKIPGDSGSSRTAGSTTLALVMGSILLVVGLVSQHAALMSDRINSVMVLAGVGIFVSVFGSFSFGYRRTVLTGAVAALALVAYLAQPRAEDGAQCECQKVVEKQAVRSTSHHAEALPATPSPAAPGSILPTLGGCDDGR